MNTFLELGVATGTSIIVAESLQLDNLWTALISFAVSLITIVGGELIKFLLAYFKKKTQELEKKEEKKDE